MKLQSEFDHEEVILRAHLARATAVSKVLSGFAAWIAHFFKQDGKAAPTLGKPA